MILRRFFSHAALALTLAFGAGAVAGQPEDAVNAQMRVVLGFEILSKGQPFNGPQVVPSKLMTAIAGKRLVGLGEGSHGTGEVQEMIGKVILEMAKRGKIVLFMEEPTASVVAINDWVHGIGAESALPELMVKNLYVIRNTVEVESFLKAVRAFNASAAVDRKIDFFGVDPIMSGGYGGMVSPSDVTIPLGAFNQANNLGLSVQLEACSRYLNDPEAYTPEGRAAAGAAAVAILVKVQGLGSGVPGQVEANVLANDLVAYMQMEAAYNNAFGMDFLDMLGSTPAVPVASSLRDAAMAENIRILMNGKMQAGWTGVYWGHNAHVGRFSYMNQGSGASGAPAAWVNTGSILGLWLGDGYYSLATLVGKGTFRIQVLEDDGSYGGFQVLNAPDPQRDSLNAIASSVNPRTPVYFNMSNLSFRWSSRQEFAPGSIVERSRVPALNVVSIPGMAYDGAISFPVSSAAHGR